MITTILLILIIIWLSVVSFYLFDVYKSLRKLTRNVKERDLLKILSKVFEKESENSKLIIQNSDKIKKLFSDEKFMLHKLGVVRFNPFSEMGGDHSFSVALLDGNNDGILLTGLHTRERTRVYMKKINKGISKVELSKEESEALKKAKVNDTLAQAKSHLVVESDSI